MLISVSSVRLVFLRCKLRHKVEADECQSRDRSTKGERRCWGYPAPEYSGDEARWQGHQSYRRIVQAVGHSATRIRHQFGNQRLAGTFGERIKQAIERVEAQIIQGAPASANPR